MLTPYIKFGIKLHIPDGVYVYNTTLQTSTKTSLCWALYGHNPQVTPKMLTTSIDPKRQDATV